MKQDSCCHNRPFCWSFSSKTLTDSVYKIKKWAAEAAHRSVTFRLDQATCSFNNDFNRVALGLFHGFSIWDLLLSTVDDNARHHTGT